MSTARILTIVGLTMLLTGCAPVTGAKSLLAIVGMLVCIGAAAWGVTDDIRAKRVEQKMTELETSIDEHINKYH